VIRAAAAAATSAAAGEAASAALEAGGSAADALIAGFFADAGAHPGVLLAPAVALVAGAGAGARVFDGRSAQPGVGAARPRGFVDDAAIPEGARVATPRALAMLVLLHTYRGRSALTSLARAGVVLAEKASAKERAALIRNAGSAGMLTLRAPEVLRALLAVGGKVAGGTLTTEDIEDARPAEEEAVSTALEAGATVLTPPFAPPDTHDAHDGGAEAIVACDGRGVLAALAYVPARSGIAIPELELTIGREAVPVRRGVTRVSPGTPLPAPAPIALLHRIGGFTAAFALPRRGRVAPASLETLASGLAAEAALAALRDQGSDEPAIAVVSDGRLARALRSGSAA
jgi:hypothetical protein